MKVLRPGHYYLTLAKDKRVKPGRIGLSGVQVKISVFVPSPPLSITLEVAAEFAFVVLQLFSTLYFLLS